MIVQPYHLYVERVVPEKNMARFYALAVQQTLFGEVLLVRSWGRIGTHGQKKVHVFNEEKHAVGLFLELVRKKRKRGYGPKPPVEIRQISYASSQCVNDKASPS
ncbi:WGR domain-containing protein [Rhizobium herbae]|uniref:DNA-binding WGR domain protein n=1 Tax=Rhizobium herbae TaxID=508661 RepID=A0ABS4EU88_9HYPH|nr:WGR domain-containing protein [Rhizobium herbae]MBP1861523.1 putative DNA-binding WGR domain protein [Rhizobium herbae]